MISVKVGQNIIDLLEKDFKDSIVVRNQGYILLAIKTEINGFENIITAYTNKKANNLFTVTFQGSNAVEVAKHYYEGELNLHKKDRKEVKESPYFIDVDEQIGSDETGTGDFLAPIVVCACYVDHDTMKMIAEYNIKDSKKMTDQKILEIIPLFLKKTFFEVKVLDNERYNAAQAKGFNINKIKAILHNHVLTKLHERCTCVKNIYVDQFTQDYNYYAALTNVTKVTRDIVFKEKGETFFPSVALASCIARYYLLSEINFKSEKIGMQIPLGAADKVNEFSKLYIEKFGIEEFNKICKQNFKNY